MACSKRERTGDCHHSQCPYPGRSGFECVDIRAGCCEIGEECNVTECQFSWRASDWKTRRIANKAFGDYAEQIAKAPNMTKMVTSW